MDSLRPNFVILPPDRRRRNWLSRQFRRHNAQRDSAHFGREVASSQALTPPIPPNGPACSTVRITRGALKTMPPTRRSLDPRRAFCRTVRRQKAPRGGPDGFPEDASPAGWACSEDRPGGAATRGSPPRWMPSCRCATQTLLPVSRPGWIAGTRRSVWATRGFTPRRRGFLLLYHSMSKRLAAMAGCPRIRLEIGPEIWQVGRSVKRATGASAAAVSGTVSGGCLVWSRSNRDRCCVGRVPG